MVNNAMKKIPNHEGLILHSDQGWHYQHVKYQNTLKKNGIEQNMSRKGNCLDNAMMENFWLKVFKIAYSEMLVHIVCTTKNILKTPKNIRRYDFYSYLCIRKIIFARLLT